MKTRIFLSIVTQQIQNNLFNNEFPPAGNYSEVTIVDRHWIYSRLSSPKLEDRVSINHTVWHVNHVVHHVINTFKISHYLSWTVTKKDDRSINRTPKKLSPELLFLQLYFFCNWKTALFYNSSKSNCCHFLVRYFSSGI